MDRRTGSTRNILFNKYEIGKLLGQGNFAKVYHGRNLSTNESVAIKVIKKERLQQKERLVKQIKREVSVMRLVRHPHIVELKEVMANKAKIFLVVEYVKGGELFAKPENLLLDENEDLKVSDFGLSALPDQRRSDGMLLTPCGTPAYVAPEVLKKKGYDGSKADIWSCGVILFALLSGYLPFQGENVMRIYSKSFRADYAFPEWISPGAKNLISNLLVVDPQKRYSIPDIMKDPWFQIGFMRPIAFSMKESAVEDNIDFSGDDVSNGSDDGNSSSNNEDGELTGAKPARPSYNAFEIISSLSNGFDLRNLFETRKRSPSMFISKFSASAVMAKLEGVAKKLNFRVTGKKEFVVRMQGATEGRKGKLAMTVEVFEVAPEVAVVRSSKSAGDTLEYLNFCEDQVCEVAPEVAVVEFAKSAGDTLEYIKFCEDQVRPSLKDIVWSWQGDANCHQ
ncbi:CBL-interacting serine/threonine-protein kinase 5 [Glycine soja]|uniref:non-specific serine/threonine protein kinase n=1 Tax=Glycine soja TaxID=3848 RepID=A0A0B2RJ82_GLYSO|nr:CBL-interacting serine/threonine-protein kinase 5 [Glycine soja]